MVIMSFTKEAPLYEACYSMKGWNVTRIFEINNKYCIRMLLFVSDCNVYI